MMQIGQVEPNAVIWRYLTFEKFVSLVKLRALWFAKLGIFEDAEEGMTPLMTRQKMRMQHKEMEAWFPDEKRKSQVRRFVEDNEQSGRDLIVASCWVIREQESRKMWIDYAKDDRGVVIRSTVQAVVRSLVRSLKGKWWIGKVDYVDLATYSGMDVYAGHQAHLRAFVKGARYSDECELRLATMNFVAPGCLNPDGSPQTQRQRNGYIDASNGPGIYVQADLSTLMIELRRAPGASECHSALIKQLLQEAKIQVAVKPSDLEGVRASSPDGAKRNPGPTSPHFSRIPLRFMRATI